MSSKLIVFRTGEHKMPRDFVFTPSGLPQRRVGNKTAEELTVVRVTVLSERVDMDEQDTIPLLRQVILGVGWMGDMFSHDRRLLIHAHAHKPMSSTQRHAERWVRITRVRSSVAKGMKLPCFDIELTDDVLRFL